MSLGIYICWWFHWFLLLTAIFIMMYGDLNPKHKTTPSKVQLYNIWGWAAAFVGFALGLLTVKNQGLPWLFLIMIFSAWRFSLAAKRYKVMSAFNR